MAHDPDETELGIFDTIGYRSYQNAREVFDALESITSASPLSLQTGRINTAQPVYLVEPKFKIDPIIRLRSRIKKAKLFYRNFDPSEEPRLSPADAIRNVAQSYGVLIPLLPSTFPEFRIHNLRAAFVAGLAQGMGKVLMVVQFGREPVPLDFRDFATPCLHPEQIDESVAEFATQIAEAFQTREVVVPETRSFLSTLRLGASAAENEFQELGNYYLETDDYRRTLRGDARTILGRKGSGKSAIFFQVRNRIRRDPANVVLDLKPEGYQLRKFKESVLQLLSQGTFEHTVTAFWEYLLLLEICHKLLENDKRRHRYDPQLSDLYSSLERAYDSDEYVREGDFAERMSRLIQAISDNYSARYSGATNIALSNQEITSLLYMHDVEALRSDLVKYLKFKKSVWLLFDNIDKGWSPRGIDVEDLTIIRCLLEATRKLERHLRSREIDAHTSVFLRVDVYDHLLEETPDRGKESKVVLDWTDADLLREMLRKRFVFSEASSTAPFLDIWRKICVAYIDGEESCQYLIDRCLMRPRYLINLISACRSHAVNLRRNRIEAEDVERGLRNYSSDLIAEIGLEIRDVLPDAENVLYALIGANRVLREEELDSCLKEAGFQDGDLIKRIKEMLLWYGVLGVWHSDDESYYIYDTNYDVRLLQGKWMKQEPRIICINPAFWKALGNE